MKVYKKAYTKQCEQEVAQRNDKIALKTENIFFVVAPVSVICFGRYRLELLREMQNNINYVSKHSLGVAGSYADDFHGDYRVYEMKKLFEDNLLYNFTWIPL